MEPDASQNVCRNRRNSRSTPRAEPYRRSRSHERARPELIPRSVVNQSNRNVSTGPSRRRNYVDEHLPFANDATFQRLLMLVNFRDTSFVQGRLTMIPENQEAVVTHTYEPVTPAIPIDPVVGIASSLEAFSMEESHTKPPNPNANAKLPSTATTSDSRSEVDEKADHSYKKVCDKSE